MPAFICTTCGTQYAPTEAPPERCLICSEERQYVLPTGQSWTTLDRLRRTHMATFRDEAGLLGIGTAPNIGIGQRALLVRGAEGNVLWDCISLIDDTIVALLRGLGGLTAIAISHPHYYTTMVEWSRAFGGIPIHLHAADREYVMRDDPCLAFWDGDSKVIAPGLTLVRTGGHYVGGTVMHWAAGAQGRGALLTGDLLQVVPDTRFVGFMYSYPNFVPLGARAVQQMAARIEPYPFEVVYGAFWDRVVARDAKQRVAASVARHVERLGMDAQ